MFDSNFLKISLISNKNFPKNFASVCPLNNEQIISNSKWIRVVYLTTDRNCKCRVSPCRCNMYTILARAEVETRLDSTLGIPKQCPCQSQWIFNLPK